MKVLNKAKIIAKGDKGLIEFLTVGDYGKERYCRIEDYGIIVEVNKVTKMVEVTVLE